MTDQSPNPSLPPVVTRKAWQEAREALFEREKAHTREGDAIAAARRRLPMVEVDATIEVIGPRGPITILDVFEGRKQLIAYFHAWWPGKPAAEQWGVRSVLPAHPERQLSGPLGDMERQQGPLGACRYKQRPGQGSAGRGLGLRRHGLG